MKKILCLAAGLLALNVTTGFGEQQPTTFNERLAAIQAKEAAAKANAPALTKFNLDFPGGTPKQLVAAIEKAMGKPLNAIIPDEISQTKIPAIKVNNVDVPQLFNAVVNMSFVYDNAAPGMERRVLSSYGFETKDGDIRRVSDDAIWYFSVYEAPKQPARKYCQFYPLADYLDAGITVDDITTVIQSGWKMAGIQTAPELKYHKETKMLMAYGEIEEMKIVGEALQALKPKNDPYIQIMKQYQKENLEKAGVLPTQKASASATNSSAENSAK
jgi:hypothetical protein